MRFKTCASVLRLPATSGSERVQCFDGTGDGGEAKPGDDSFTGGGEAGVGFAVPAVGVHLDDGGAGFVDGSGHEERVVLGKSVAEEHGRGFGVNGPDHLGRGGAADDPGARRQRRQFDISGDDDGAQSPGPDAYTGSSEVTPLV